MDSRGNGNGVRSNNRSLSMSDTESQYQSPLRSESPLRSDDPDPTPAKSPSKPFADKFYSPNLSPFENHENHNNHSQKKNKNNFEAPPSTLALYNSRAVREEAVVKKKAVGGEGDLEDGVVGEEEEEEERERRRGDGGLRRTEREVVLKRGELAFRVCEVALCMISFSVMAADKTQGWSGDSFDRYKEYRYCVAVTVIGFAYAAFQACDLSYQLATSKYLCFHPLRCHFDFAMDQILAYLLISASSSAATRVDDWVLNWGKDEFTEMASASIGMSFLAFAAFSLSALISGYNLCNRSTS